MSKKERKEGLEGKGGITLTHTRHRYHRQIFMRRMYYTDRCIMTVYYVYKLSFVTSVHQLKLTRLPIVSSTC